MKILILCEELLKQVIFVIEPPTEKSDDTNLTSFLESLFEKT